jgi:hypothetical protein
MREQVQGKETSWLSKYEEKNLLKNFGMQNMKGTRHIRVRRWIYEANQCRGDFVGWQ